MILTKLTDAIKRQDWFQVLIEVLIVVIGIFLGLQVSAWNDARLERSAEQEYLARLHQDFSQSIANNETRMNRVYDMGQDIKIIADSLESCTLADQHRDTFARGIFGMGKYVPLRLTGMAVDELKSTGKFQIIQNSEIREAIAWNITEIGNQAEIAAAVSTGIAPHLYAIEKEFSHKVEDADPEFPFPPVTWENVNVDFETLCQNEQVKNSISQIYRYMRGYSSRAYQVLEQQREIQGMLKTEMEGGL